VDDGQASTKPGEEETLDVAESSANVEAAEPMAAKTKTTARKPSAKKSKAA
jgi:hypothetical protein